VYNTLTYGYEPTLPTRKREISMHTIRQAEEQILLSALRNQARHAAELRERRAAGERVSRCAFSGQGRCARADRSHSCLDAVAARHADSKRVIRQMTASHPGLSESLLSDTSDSPTSHKTP
ncbi:MAG TPA: hypothetical protein VN420_04270, partial [Candidatus Fimivivens sp.]|nr:hypothetical protein [Candidatus Fimivivens sp.]